ncbi:hypothetical protein FACS1894199_14560 [Bacteroidia bacterium]|nr:hypothetical protein FACS1894199_14560 [Bacteroidia bacterium]
MGVGAMAQSVDGGTTGACRWELTGSSPNYTLTISGTGNYAGSSGSTTFIINPAPLTVTPDAGQSKIAGGPDPTTYTYTTSGNYILTFTTGITFEIKPETSDNTNVSSVTVSNTTKVAGVMDFYLANCGTTSAQITVTSEERASQVIYKGTTGSTFPVDISRPDIYDIAYTIHSTDSSAQDYNLQIESRFAFTDIVGMKFNNAFT